MYSFLFADMAMLGQELMLCKADDLDLINVIILPIQVFRIGGKKKKKRNMSDFASVVYYHSVPSMYSG